MRHFTDGCGQTFANKGLGYVPVGCGIGVAMSTASLVKGSVSHEMAEASASPVPPVPPRVPPAPVPPSCPDGWRLFTQAQMAAAGPYLVNQTQQTTPPSTSRCVLTFRDPGPAPTPLGAGKCDQWRINFPDLLEGIRQALAFHGPAVTARAIDSVLLGGKLTVEYFPGKEQLVPLLRSIGGAGGDGAFLVNCARGPVG